MVEIVLSTYNGALYLGELFDSILDQTYTHWKMLIRDDGSSDSTHLIISEYAASHPGRFELIEDDLGNLGPSRSFNMLLMAARSNYLAICDQDDLWYPDKLDRQMNIIKEIEKQNGRDMPILVHSDLFVCGHSMSPIAGSLWKYQKTDPEEMKDIRCLLMQNFVTGCTLLMNRALCQCALPVPRNVMMFDWWIALVAIQAGKIVTIPAPLVQYRQHGFNAVGAKKWGVRYFISRVFQVKNGFWAGLRETQIQADELWRHLEKKDVDYADIIKKYGSFHQKNWLYRKRSYITMGLRKYGRIKQFITWLLI